MRFVKTVNINFADNLPTFPITKSLWSYLKLLLICLLELGFGFDQSLPRGKPVGKSPYYRSIDRSANWRVKDSMSANECSKSRLSAVQPRQSVWIPYQCRNWTATWSVLIVLLSQMSATERVLAYDSCDRWKWKQNRQILWRSSVVLKLVVSRQFSNKNRQCVIVALLPLTILTFSGLKWPIRILQSVDARGTGNHPVHNVSWRETLPYH